MKFFAPTTPTFREMYHQDRAGVLVAMATCGLMIGGAVLGLSTSDGSAEGKIAGPTRPDVILDDFDEEGTRSRITAGEITHDDGTVVSYVSFVAMRCAGEVSSTFEEVMTTITSNPDNPIISDRTNYPLSPACENGRYNPADAIV